MNETLVKIKRLTFAKNNSQLSIPTNPSQRLTSWKATQKIRTRRAYWQVVSENKESEWFVYNQQTYRIATWHQIEVCSKIKMFPTHWFRQATATNWDKLIDNREIREAGMMIKKSRSLRIFRERLGGRKEDFLSLVYVLCDFKYRKEKQIFSSAILCMRWDSSGC